MSILLAVATSVQLTIHRAPAAAVEKAGAKPEEVRTIPMSVSGCGENVVLKGLAYSQDVKVNGQTIEVDVHGEVTVEKSAKGPFPAPVVVLTFPKGTLRFALEDSMISATWENGGTFRQSLYSAEMVDGGQWRSVELRCSASPWRAAVVPDNVTYVRDNDAAVAAKVTMLLNALKTDAGLATPSLYGAVLLIGPHLTSALDSDPEIAPLKNKGLTAVMDPDTGKLKRQMRAIGEKEIAIFASALRRYAGSSPRIRAATASELAKHWPDIGWDIHEPFVVADYGAHRFVIDYMDGSHILTIDEVTP